MIDWDKQKEYSKKLLTNTLSLIDKIEVESTDFGLQLNSTEIKKSTGNINQLIKEAFAEIDFDPIYCIQLKGNCNTKEIAKAFNTARTDKKAGRCYSKFNHNDSKTLYVGISQGKSFKKRMREHLGAGAKSTYALNLKYWIPEDIKFEILVFKTSIPEYGKKENLKKTARP